MYNVLNYKKIKFNILSGVSTLFTTDYYLTDLIIYNNPGNIGTHIDFATKYSVKATYWRVPIGISIEYPIYKNKISVNANFDYRYYNNDFPQAFFYGLNIGYKF